MAEALNNIYVKRTNKRSVYNLLYWEKSATKKDLAQKLGLSLPTVSQIMKELEEAGLVRTTGLQASSGGRKAKLISIVNDSFYAVGIGITMHHVRLAVLNLGQDVIARERYRQRFSDTPEYWQDVADKVHDFLLRHIPAGENMGVGMSLPGIVDNENARLDFALTLDVPSIDLARVRSFGAKDLSILFGRSSVLAGKAEQWFRKSDAPAVYLMLNNDVGGSIMLQGEEGRFGPRSAEFGHMTVEKNGRRCSCGRRGCFEAYCSSRVLMDESGLPLEDFFAQLPENGQFQKLWDEYLDYLALGITNLRSLFDVDVIVGGEMSRYLSEYTGELQKRLEEQALFPGDISYLHLSNYSEYDAAIGAALLQIEKFLDI